MAPFVTTKTSSVRTVRKLVTANTNAQNKRISRLTFSVGCAVTRVIWLVTARLNLILTLHPDQLWLCRTTEGQPILIPSTRVSWPNLAKEEEVEGEGPGLGRGLQVLMRDLTFTPGVVQRCGLRPELIKISRITDLLSNNTDRLATTVLGTMVARLRHGIKAKVVLHLVVGMAATVGARIIRPRTLNTIRTSIVNHRRRRPPNSNQRFRRLIDNFRLLPATYGDIPIPILITILPAMVGRLIIGSYSLSIEVAGRRKKSPGTRTRTHFPFSQR